MVHRRKKVETVTVFYFGGFKITVESDCSHEIKVCLLLGRKAMTNLDSIFQSRDITCMTKVRVVKAMILVVMYGSQSCSIMKVEHWRINAFKPWCWRRLLRVSWTARRWTSYSKGSLPRVFIGKAGAEAEAPILCHLMGSAHPLEKTLMLRKIESRR